MSPVCSRETYHSKERNNPNDISKEKKKAGWKGRHLREEREEEEERREMMRK